MEWTKRNVNRSGKQRGRRILAKGLQTSKSAVGTGGPSYAISPQGGIQSSCAERLPKSRVVHVEGLQAN